MRKTQRLLTAIAVGFSLLLSCGPAKDTGEGVPWSINVPDLSVRLLIKDTSIDLGKYPACVMEVMNSSQQTILLSKRFSLNGPAVFDAAGQPMPQRRPLELAPVEGSLYHRIEPGRTISIRTRPNYKMDARGRYILQFSIHPQWWGFEDPGNPGTLTESREAGLEPAVSNEMTVTVY